MSTQHLHFKKRWWFTGAYCIAVALLTLLRPLPAKAQNPAANLDQGSNGKSTSPTDPVDWVNGNLNENTAHFREGYSVPYRAILTGLTVNQTYTLVIGYDIKNGGKQALDYITQYQRLEPHAIFGHPAETVNPLLSINGFPPSYFTSTDTYPIPPPSSAGSPVAGQPTTSFNALPAAERVMTGFNADVTGVTYSSQGDLNAAQSETVINVTFTALKETVVLSWGGHIASVDDWGVDPATGEPRSATGISGSPYHMRLKEWIINGQEVSIGNQDRSLKTGAVFAPPQCTETGPTSACAETSSLNYTATISGDTTGATFAWTLLNNTTNAVIVNSTLKNITVVPSSGTFTAGSFNLRLIVSNSHGLKDTCYLNSHVSPGDLVTIKKVVVDATATPSTLDLAISNHSQLNASASGGTGSYGYVWAPATGLSSTTIANPVFTAPGPGSFQFIVTVTDASGCVGKDTVVVTVTASKMPCDVTGPSPVCPSSTNTYNAPPDPNGLIGSYSWFIKTSVGSSIQGAANGTSVSIKSGPHCGTDTLYVATTSTSGLLHDTCSIIILIQDATAPVLSGVPDNTTVACASNVPAPANVTATDNCGLVRLNYSQVTQDSSCVNKFTIVRTWTATDSCGNTASASQTITVKDSIAPAITANFDKSVSVQCVSQIPEVPTPTASDNCGGSVTMAFSATGSGKACDSTITRKWIFTDACGNKDSVWQVVHVKDTIPPTLSGSAPNASFTCAKDVTAPPTITATDNCDASPVVTYNQVTSDSTCINHFTLTRTWFATDNCGNMSATLTQVITVNDNVKPQITANFVKDTSVQCVSQIPAVPTATASDNCSGDISPVYSATGSGTGCDSTITRKWLFMDACGNKDSVSQVIHVKDTTRPVISGDITNANVTCAKDVPAPPTVTATDNCDATPVITYNQATSDSTCANHFTLTRTWFATDNCGNVSATLTQIITVNDNVKPVISGDFVKDTSVQCLSQVPDLPSPTASDNCSDGISPVLTSTGSGTACDSTITRTWLFMDACGNKDSVSQVIHVKDTTRPVISGDISNASVTCAKDVPAKPTVTASDNCDVNPLIIYNQVTSDSTCVNHFTVTRTWYAMDKCGNVSSTLTQVITVNDNVKPTVVFTPANTTIGCNATPVFGTPVFSDNCGGAVKIDSMTWVEGTTCPFNHIRRWIATDACGNKDSTQQTITVSCCPVTCTYTQGFYGNQGGIGCASDKSTFTAKAKMAAIVDAQPGDSVIFGLISGKYFTLQLSDITSGNIFNMLPGGGTPAALKGYATYSKKNTWPNVPLVTSGSQTGKIKNNLLSQTMTLFFNMNVSSDLAAMAIQSDSLFTAKQTTCGSGVPVPHTDTTLLPANVVNYLQMSGAATVKGLYDLANRYLGGQTVSGVSAADITNAIDAINQAFDECALLIGWGNNASAIIASRLVTNNTTAGITDEPPTADMQLSVFPNPYGSIVNFRFRTPISGRVELVIYNIVGAKLAVIDKGYIQAQTWQTIQYHVPEGSHPVLVYRLLTGTHIVSGKILPHRQ